MPNEYAIQLVQPACPSCGRLLENTVAAGTLHASRVRCRCTWEGLAVFFVRQTESVEAITPTQLDESRLFFRRRLTEKIAVAMIKKGYSIADVSAWTEGLAQALTERVAARETGDETP